MSLTVTSIVTVATIAAALYFSVAGAEDNIDAPGGESRGKMASVRGKRAAILAGHRQKRQTLSILPGTKWCGKGNRAEHDEDLGSHPVEDSCCRDHDKCYDYIIAGFTRTFRTSTNVTYNITNEHFYTISNCECDEAFMKCLHDVGSPKADEIGYWFFNWFHPFCLAYDHPRVCVQRMFLYWGPCSREEPDTSAEKRWFLKESDYYYAEKEKTRKNCTRGNDLLDDCDNNEIDFESFLPATVDQGLGQETSPQWDIINEPETQTTPQRPTTMSIISSTTPPETPTTTPRTSTLSQKPTTLQQRSTTMPPRPRESTERSTTTETTRPRQDDDDLAWTSEIPETKVPKKISTETPWKQTKADSSFNSVLPGGGKIPRLATKILSKDSTKQWNATGHSPSPPSLGGNRTNSSSTASTGATRRISNGFPILFVALLLPAFVL